jgi:hypothetical protein
MIQGAQFIPRQFGCAIVDGAVVCNAEQTIDSTDMSKKGNKVRDEILGSEFCYSVLVDLTGQCFSAAASDVIVVD